METYKGRVTIVVNVASEWGYAKYHYPQLQTMYEDYEEQGFSVVAFPCNQFGGQEPGTNEEIKEHVESKYGITFDMMSKIDVNGPSKSLFNDNTGWTINSAQHPIYEWLISSDVGGDRRIQWNFTNFVIDRCGRIRSRHEPPEHPVTFEEEILDLLAEDTSKC